MKISPVRQTYGRTDGQTWRS